MSLGKQLQTIRMKAGVSQGEMAKKMGYGSPQFVSNWERDLCGIPLTKVITFCRVTDAKVADVRKLLVSEAIRKIDSALKPARKVKITAEKKPTA